jgi:protein TonB
MMRPLTLFASLGIHLAIVGIGMAATARAPIPDRSRRVIIRVAPRPPVLDEEPARPPPPPPPPKSVVGLDRHPLAPRAQTTAAPSPARAESSAPYVSGVVLSNGSGGSVAASSTPPPPTPPPVTEPTRTRVLRASAEPATDACDEPLQKPRPIDRPSDIEYSAEARANGVEGRLVLKISVGADGIVEDVEVASSVDAVLDAAAVRTVKAWRFEPARRCGKALRATYTLARRFELGD